MTSRKIDFRAILDPGNQEIIKIQNRVMNLMLAKKYEILDIGLLLLYF